MLGSQLYDEEVKLNKAIRKTTTKKRKSFSEIVRFKDANEMELYLLDIKIYNSDFFETPQGLVVNKKDCQELYERVIV